MHAAAFFSVNNVGGINTNGSGDDHDATSNDDDDSRDDSRNDSRNKGERPNASRNRNGGSRGNMPKQGSAQEWRTTGLALPQNKSEGAACVPPYFVKHQLEAEMIVHLQAPGKWGMAAFGDSAA